MQLGRLTTLIKLALFIESYFSSQVYKTKLRRPFKFSDKTCGIGRKFSVKNVATISMETSL